MKRIVSILLLTVFLFNVGGYYLVFWGLRHHANIELKARLDADLYHQEDLIELKLPLSLPYPVEQQEYERANGKFEHKGEYYKLVKQKFQNDTLYVLCIKDHEEKQLVKTMTDYVEVTSDLPASSKNELHVFGKLLKDFESANPEKLIHQDGWLQEIAFVIVSPSTLTRSSNIQSPPPKV